MHLISALQICSQRWYKDVGLVFLILAAGASVPVVIEANCLVLDLGVQWLCSTFGLV